MEILIINTQWIPSHNCTYVSHPFIAATKPVTAFKQFEEIIGSNIDSCFPSSCTVSGGTPGRNTLLYSLSDTSLKVLVKGKGFDEKMQIVFDTIPVNIKFNSDKEIICVAPPHPEGLVQVYLSKCGSCDSNKVLFRYDEDPQVLKSLYLVI